MSQLSFAKSKKTLANPVLHTDVYKLGHLFMEPEGTERIFANFTPRFNPYFKAAYPEHDGKVVVFGIQAFILEELVENWNEGFFNRPKQEVLDEIREYYYPFVGMDYSSLTHFAKLHDLGYLPLRIKALKEGTEVPLNIPVMTMTNTHPEFSWLTNYIESVLSTYCWKPMTTATTARELAKLRDKWWDLTVVDHSLKMFSIHDFSYRGHAIHMSAAYCGAATLLYSSGTDNVPGVVLARELYGSPADVAGSIPASEHSVTTLGINFFQNYVLEGELKQLAGELRAHLVAINAEDEYQQALGELITIYRLLTEVYPTGLLSYVADSYDYWRVITIILPILKGVITRRAGKLVIRPDSGDPVKIVCGDELGLEEHEVKGSIEVLSDIFGYTVNGLGYKELPACIGLIYGDGITYKRAEGIYSGLEAKGFAVSNVVLGVGSYTFAGGTRDSLGFAVKATYAIVKGQSVPIYKAPKTDAAKVSARGLLRVVEVDGEIVLESDVTPENEMTGLLQTVFEDGKAINLQYFQDIRNRLGWK